MKKKAFTITIPKELLRMKVRSKPMPSREHRDKKTYSRRRKHMAKSSQ